MVARSTAVTGTGPSPVTSSVMSRASPDANVTPSCRAANHSPKRSPGEHQPDQKASQSDGVSDAQSDAVSDGVSDAIPTGDSRGGAPDRVLNVERRTESLSGRDSSDARDERDDVQALRDRGWKRVTKAQRRVLDEVLDRHDVTGPAFAAEVIRATPADRDPLAEVMKADAAWQDIQRRRAEAEEEAWAKEKAAVAEPDWLATPAGKST